MKKSVIVTLLVFVGAALPWAATAQEVMYVDCKYHNAKVDYSTGAPLAPWGDFDECFDGAKVVGTLNGTYGYCVDYDTFLTSAFIFGDIYEQIETGKYESWVVTKKGTLEMREWSWFDGDFGVETGFAKVIGGTGVFEGKAGPLLWYPRWPDRSGFAVPFEGYICTVVPVPED